MAWAEINAPDAIVTERKLVKSELKRLIFRQGEAIPGIDAELGRDELYIKSSL